MIATDLDGTLLDPWGRLTARTATALRAAAEAGIVVVLASGRPPHVLGDELRQFGDAVPYGVLANGTMVCTLPDGAVLHFIGFATQIARDAIGALRASDARYGFALATDRGFAAEPGFTERMPVHPGDVPVNDALIGHEDSEETIKLIVFHADHGALDLLGMVPAVVGDHLAVTHMGAEAVELGPPGLDKGAGLQWLCRHLAIDTDEIVVFGDEVNDLSMFAMAGRSFAMANAAPSVIDAATDVTASNVDDGVAVAIEAMLAHR